MNFTEFHVDWMSPEEVYLHRENTSSQLYRGISASLGFRKPVGKPTTFYFQNPKVFSFQPWPSMFYSRFRDLAFSISSWHEEERKKYLTLPNLKVSSSQNFDCFFFFMPFSFFLKTKMFLIHDISNAILHLFNRNVRNF